MTQFLAAVSALLGIERSGAGERVVHDVARLTFGAGRRAFGVERLERCE